MSDRLSRREFIKSALGITSALSGPTIISYLGKSSPSSDKEILEVRDGNFYMGGEEYTIKGANYQTRNYPWRMLKEYHPESIEKELDIAKELGINSLRVPLTAPYALKGDKFELVRDQSINEDYFENFDDFLDITNSRGIKVLPIVFDQVPWMVFKPQNFSEAISYLKNWLTDFSDDERILAWDIINEPDVIEYNLNECNKEGYRLQEFAGAMYDAIKEIDDKHAITVGTSDVSLFKKEKKLMDDLPNYIDREDFGCIHFYIHPKHLDRVLSKTKKITDKPILLEEFGLPTTDKDKWHTEEFQKKYYADVLEKENRENLGGAMFWKLNDHPEKLGELEIDIGGVYDNDHHKPRASKFGILRTDYSKKPAAHVVEQYYKWIL